MDIVQIGLSRPIEIGGTVGWLDRQLLSRRMVILVRLSPLPPCQSQSQYQAQSQSQSQAHL